MWTEFGVSSRGGTHIRYGMPCQDASLCRNGKGYWIATAADGHGSRRHFRSQKGAVLACQAACDCIERFTQALAPDHMPSEIDVQLLKQNILHTWRKSVEEDAARHIWSIEELLEQNVLLSEAEYAALVHEGSVWIPYGSTLAALLVTRDFWLALQIGDGDVMTISRDGVFAWPMPESKINHGCYTASLCMANPMPEFRHCTGRKLPAVLLAYTDGVEKAFASKGKTLVEFLYAIWHVAHQGNEAEVRAAMTVLAQQGPVKDDATLVGLIDTAVDIPFPKLDELQRNEELQRIRAQIMEYTSTMAYNSVRLQQMNRFHPDNALTAEQMEQIVQRCQKQLEALQAEEQRLLSMDEESINMNPEEDTPNMTWAAMPKGTDGEANDFNDI